MNNIIYGINVIWAIPIILFIHEIEEWNILSWYKAHFVNLPKSTNTSVRIHIIVFGIIEFLLTIIAYHSHNIIIFSILIIFLFGFIFTNTIQHILITFISKSYMPGLITAIIATTINIYANIILIKKNLIFSPIYFIMVLCIPSIIQTIKL